ncbi:MAG: shikimate kinase AroL [Desulfovibrionaceae bacterium]
MRRTVFLIGGRASGKTTLGRLLAERLTEPFVDTDDLVVENVGMSIAEYVAQQGWEAFRDRETEALRSVCGGPPLVVACGGGIVLREANRAMLAQGLTIYLHAPAGVLAQRLAADPKEAQRPSLTGKALAEEVAMVLAEREPLYRACAWAVLPSNQEMAELLDAVLEIVQDHERV